MPTIRTISPATNQVVYETLETSPEDAVAIAVKSAQVFQSWKNVPLHQRKSIVSKALALVQERKEELGRELTTQMGRPIAYSAKEIETMQKRADYLLQTVDAALDVIPGTQEDGFERWVQKEPIGPTLVIFAWNFPYLILVNALVPALLAGNSVILKPSPQTPLIATRFKEVFEEAGLPKDVLQVVQSGSIQLVESLAQRPEIQLVTFTGSTAGGLALRAATAARFVPLNLELGGNDPAYVRQDADLAYVAAQLVDGAVFNAGQSCCAVERVYVHDEVHDAFVQALKNELATYKLGDPFDESTNVGPVISRAAVEGIHAQIKDALSKGARNETPEVVSFQNPPADGNYVSPTLLVNVNHSMKVMREETFGPVIPVQRVASDDEAVRLMNDSEYGLTASVWTKDLDAGKALIQRLEAGTVFINRADYPSPDLAWTGWKISGLGCTLGPRAFNAFVKLRSFHVKHSQGSG